ncbi:helix-hairpin-helix domain-containing protein [Bacillus sp. FJAT-27251]|uniref:helix-hairpin-helix domain-containing protein n=1 Tax=Bacillus sp. FJAT-27251 TaxID=1684142 RepID=UPI000AEC487B|nr:helix-hairpin-helix domain-containing protein [Bacillus sp. FJAT-27251]
MEWLKAHLWQAGAGAALGIFFLYVYLGGPAEKKEDDLQEWSIVEEKDQVQESQTQAEVAATVPMMADIKGAVAKPGVYEIDEGDRIVDLVEKAGGLTEDAESSAINFAMKVSDEMAVYIPGKGEGQEGSILPAGAIGAGEKEGKVNLNSASAAELETLPGIGPAKSSAIIEYRETAGPFKNIEDLKNISGIGDKTFEKLESMIIVK